MFAYMVGGEEDEERQKLLATSRRFVVCEKLREEEERDGGKRGEEIWEQGRMEDYDFIVIVGCWQRGMGRRNFRGGESEGYIVSTECKILCCLFVCLFFFVEYIILLLILFYWRCFLLNGLLNFGIFGFLWNFGIDYFCIILDSVLWNLRLFVFMEFEIVCFYGI